jgi:hypothetical protein
LDARCWRRSTTGSDFALDRVALDRDATQRKYDMLLHIPNVLNAEQLRFMRERLDGAGDAWVDGRATAGYQGAPVKRNQQIAEHSPVARELGDVILA